MVMCVLTVRRGDVGGFLIDRRPFGLLRQALRWVSRCCGWGGGPVRGDSMCTISRYPIDKNPYVSLKLPRTCFQAASKSYEVD